MPLTPTTNLHHHVVTHHGDRRRWRPLKVGLRQETEWRSQGCRSRVKTGTDQGIMVLYIGTSPTLTAQSTRRVVSGPYGLASHQIAHDRYQARAARVGACAQETSSPASREGGRQGATAGDRRLDKCLHRRFEKAVEVNSCEGKVKKRCFLMSKLTFAFLIY